MTRVPATTDMKLLSPAQRGTMCQCKCPGHPAPATRFKFKHPGMPYQITLEDWRLPDGEDLIEVSIKAPNAQAAAAASAFTGFLTELGLKPEGGQQAKTRVALESSLKLKKAA